MWQIRKERDGVLTLYEYNEDRLTEATSLHSSVTLTYNSDNLIGSVTYDSNFTLQYQYNTLGRRTALSTGDGNYDVTYEYDARQRLSTVKLTQPTAKTLVTVLTAAINICHGCSLYCFLHTCCPLFANASLYRFVNIFFTV